MTKLFVSTTAGGTPFSNRDLDIDDLLSFDDATYPVHTKKHFQVQATDGNEDVQVDVYGSKFRYDGDDALVSGRIKTIVATVDGEVEARLTGLNARVETLLAFAADPDEKSSALPAFVPRQRLHVRLVPG